METKNNSGAIFKNDKKTAENHPDYKGRVNVNGKEMEIALWLKDSMKGTKYFSVAFSEPYVKQVFRETTIKVDNSDDDLPF
jgi:uncharacterized protein (DUF736 family)